MPCMLCTYISLIPRRTRLAIYVHTYMLCYAFMLCYALVVRKEYNYLIFTSMCLQCIVAFCVHICMTWYVYWSCDCYITATSCPTSSDNPVSGPSHLAGIISTQDGAVDCYSFGILSQSLGYAQADI